VKTKHYLLTQTAANDFRRAKAWSLKRWGKENTTSYFQHIENIANELGKQTLLAKTDVLDVDNLSIWPIKEHYLVYIPLDNELIAIVGLFRQTQDLTSIIQNNSFAFKHQFAKLALRQQRKKHV
jgi:plasmid stabilization system protein ParE